MENKEKQIEEMAKDYYGYSIDLEEDCKFVAEEMYDKGHRKLTENSVVLSREEYTKNLNTHYYMGQREVEEEYKTIQIPKERKETAEKAFEITKKIIDKKYAIETPWTRATLSNIINQIEKEFAKQFDVEIKE